MTDTKSHQMEFWNTGRGSAWARYADGIDFILSDVTAAIFDAIPLGVGDHVIDLGCGNGGTALAIADRVGPTGSVTAIDISRPMIERGQQRAEATNLTNITFVVGDATIAPLPLGLFDALISRLGCMFFDKPVDAFRRMRSAMKQGGRFSIGVWRSPRENLWAMEPVSAARQYLQMAPRPGPNDPGAFSFADPDRVRRILSDAGWTDAVFAPVNFQLPMGRTDEEALTFITELGPLSAPLYSATAKNRSAAITAIENVLEANRNEDGAIRLAAACWIITARRD